MMNFVLSMFIVLVCARLTSAQTTKLEVETAYKHLLEIAKTAGYDGHVNERGQPLTGLKSRLQTSLLGSGQTLEQAKAIQQIRTNNVRSVAEGFYEMTHDKTGLVQELTFEPIKVTLNGEFAAMVESSVLFPPTDDGYQFGFKWIWHLRRAGTEWMAFDIHETRFSKPP
ncbi:MAG: hypothetical protein NUV80_02175 [Candidatus Berkelbacteria bacterium]|nr:hypothetical protein [Candidatus Berkelbacteria bacterium]MCR4307340.1 hypothetical protein [Candidatus Berkelbacteria bacterium]